MLGGFQPESVEREGQRSFQTFLGKDPAVNSREYRNTLFAPHTCKLKSGDKSKMPVFPVGRKLGNDVLFSGHLIRENAL